MKKKKLLIGCVIGGVILIMAALCFAIHLLFYSSVWHHLELSSDKKTLIKCPDIVKYAIIPSSVTTIGRGAFEKCRNLRSVIIPNSVTTIEEDAFAFCCYLERVTIPNSVKSIGECAFFGVPSVNVSSDHPVFMVDDSGALIDKKREKLIRFCTGKQGNIIFIEGKIDYVIPDGVKTIGKRAFACCSDLKSITIPDSVTTIEAQAFAGCSNLRNIINSDSVTTIEAQAFAGCSNLRNIIIPDSVTTIAWGTFSGCRQLESVTITNRVKTIEHSAFSNCDGLHSVTISTETKYESNSFPINCKINQR